jgi:hypothetical protein
MSRSTLVYLFLCLSLTSCGLVNKLTGKSENEAGPSLAEDAAVPQSASSAAPSQSSGGKASADIIRNDRATGLAANALNLSTLAAPTNVVARVMPSGVVRISWDFPATLSNVTFQVQRVIGDQAFNAGALVSNCSGTSSFGATVRSTDDCITLLLPLNPAYKYRVAVRDGSSVANSAVAALSYQAPAVPGLSLAGINFYYYASAVETSPGSLAVFNYSILDSTVTSVRLTQSTSESGRYDLVRGLSLQRDQDQVTLPGLLPNTDYFYRVESTNPAGTTASAPIRLHTPSAPTAPAFGAIRNTSGYSLEVAFTEGTNFLFTRATLSAPGLTESYVYFPGRGPAIFANLKQGTAYNITLTSVAPNFGQASVSKSVTTKARPAAPTLAFSNPRASGQFGRLNILVVPAAGTETFELQRADTLTPTVFRLVTGGDLSHVNVSDLVEQGHSYIYRVYGYNTAGLSPSRDASSPAIPYSAPPAPTLTGISQRPGNGLDVTWTDNSRNETQFLIVRQSPSPAIIGTVAANVTSASLSNVLIPGAKNVIYVAAKNPAGSASSNTKDLIASGPPAAPTALHITVVPNTQGRNIVLSWHDNSDGVSSISEDTFNVYRVQNGGTVSRIGQVGRNVTTLADSTPTAGTDYAYAVRAANAFGESGPSNTANFSTYFKPNLATNIRITGWPGEHGQVSVAWANGAVTRLAPVDGYHLRLTRVGGETTLITPVGASSPDITAQSATIGGLVRGAAYLLTVRPYNIAGEAETATPFPIRDAFRDELTIYMEPSASFAYFDPGVGTNGQGIEIVKYGDPFNSVPASGDYFGDGRPRKAIFHKPSRMYFIEGFPQPMGPFNLGQDTDRPLPFRVGGDAQEAIAFQSTTGALNGNVVYDRAGQQPVLFPFSFINPARNHRLQALRGIYRPGQVTEVAGVDLDTMQWQFPDGTIQSFGGPGDLPLENVDLDGDGRIERLAVYRPTTGQILAIRSSDNQGMTMNFVPGLIPRFGDWNGVHRSLPGGFEPDSATLFWQTSDGALHVQQFGYPGHTLTDRSLPHHLRP